MKRLLAGRNDQEGIELLYERFVPLIVGKNTFRNRLASGNPDALCTPSDEAMALVLLENSKERFEDIFDTYGMGVFTTSGRKRKFESNVPTKYSRGGITYTESFDFSIFDGGVKKGWTLEGLKRFNEIWAKVKQDRLENMGALTDWIMARKQSIEPKKQISKPLQEVVKVKNDLWDSDDDKKDDEGSDDSDSDDDKSADVKPVAC